MTPLLSLLLAANVPVTFQVNDSSVKDKVLPEVSISVAPAPDAAPLVQGATNREGRFVTELPPGNYVVTYRAHRYAPIESSFLSTKAPPQAEPQAEPKAEPQTEAQAEPQTEAQAEPQAEPQTEPQTEQQAEPQPVTVNTTMTLLTEETGRSARSRIQLVLSWGSKAGQVRDADAHLVCSDGAENGHVYYEHRGHAGNGYSAALDLDHTEGPGPETVTIADAPPGSYSYWVYNYSEVPALGTSEVVVKVLFGDKVAGEYRIPEDVTAGIWRPFKALFVEPSGEPFVLPFSADELQAGDDRHLPAGAPTGGMPAFSPWGLALREHGNYALLPFLVLLVLAALGLKRLGGRRRIHPSAGGQVVPE